MIAGGYDKNLDYTPIAKPILDNCKELILMGATADKIEAAVTEEMKKNNKTVGIHRCSSLEEVVRKADEISKPGDVVLFSPASASFDMFKNFADRGIQFKEKVIELIK